MALSSTLQLTGEQRDRVMALAAREEADSGRRPLGEATRLALADPDRDTGFRHWLWHDPDLRAYAAFDPASRTVEMAAAPTDPGAAHAFLSALRTQIVDAHLWTHGDRAQARIAAAMAGLALERELLLMSRSLVGLPEGPPMPMGTTVRAFDPQRDQQEWLELNAIAFAALPDQGSMTAADLGRKLAEPWTDLPGFLVAESDGVMTGFHWTKRDPDARSDGEESGEVYVLGVRPQVQGNGLARALLHLGLQHLRDAGLDHAHLFVDAANEPAIRLYLAAGFRQVDTDRLYTW